MFFRKCRPSEIKPVDPVVNEAKERTHKAASSAKKNADRLNKVFAENGITLNILRIAGSKHGR